MVLRLEVVDEAGVRQVRMLAGDNGLDEAMAHALTDAMRVPESTRAVLLRGQQEVFSRGATAEVLDGLSSRKIRPSELLLPRSILGCAVPVIAAMEGHAIGGGLLLGVACDLALIAEESRYGATFISHGFTPGMGATRLLERFMSAAQAHELLLGGEPKRGRDLRGHGFNAVLPRQEVWPGAVELARRIAEKEAGAVRLLKAALAAPWRAAFEAAHAEEVEMHEVCFAE